MALLVLSGQLAEENDVVRFSSPQGGERMLPSATLRQPGIGLHRISKAARSAAMGHVKDVIERRGDSRAKASEPFPAFAERLEGLG